MDKYNDMKPFRFWCQKVLPTIYDDSLSYYELLTKVVKALNDMIGNNDLLYQEIQNLKEYVDNYFDTVDFQEFVDNKLDEMAEDGTLENMIKKFVSSRNIHIVRYGRLLDRFTINQTSQKLYCQGMTYADGKYYVCGSWDNESIQSITVWNDNGEYVNGRTTYTQLYHANDIAKIDDKLYIATGESRVVIIDATTLDVLGEIGGLLDMGFDTCSALGVDGKKLIICGGTASYKFGFAVYDTESAELTRKAWNIYKPNNVNQGGCFYKGHYYRLFNRDNQVAEIDIETGEIVTVYNYPDNDGYFYIGEPESLFVKDDKIFMACDTYAPDFTLHMYNSALCQIFETDITGATMMVYNPNYMQPWTPATIKVNQGASYEFNPMTTFTCAEEVNALVRDMVIELVNCTTGYIWRHGESLSIYGSGTNRTLERVRLYASRGNISSCTVNYLVCLQSEAIFNYVTLSHMEVRYSHITATSSRLCLNITQQSYIKHLINNYSGWVDGSEYTSTDGTIIDQINLRPSNANMTQYVLPNINANLAAFANTVTVIFSITVLTNDGYTVKIETSFTKTNWIDGFTRTMGEWTLTIGANGGSISVQRNGANVTVARYSDIHFIV